jgi:hypothetical protein
MAIQNMEVMDITKIFYDNRKSKSREFESMRDNMKKKVPHPKPGVMSKEEFFGRFIVPASKKYFNPKPNGKAK